MNEFINSNNYEKKFMTKNVEITIAKYTSNGTDTVFSVGESIGILFTVEINGIVQTRDVDFFHVGYTSKISFSSPPRENSQISIKYYKGKSNVYIDSSGNPRQVSTETFTYDGTSLEFTTLNTIDSVVSFDLNGLTQQEGESFEVSGRTNLRLLGTPRVGTIIGVTYLH